MLTERETVVAEDEDDRVVGDRVHERSELLVDRLHVPDIGLTNPVYVLVGELKLDEPSVRRAEAVGLRAARADVEGRSIEGVRGVEGIHGDEERVGALQLAERLDSLGHRALRGGSEALERGQELVVEAGRQRVGLAAARSPHVREALPAEHRVVGHVDRLNAGCARDLHQQWLVVPYRVEAGYGREALEPPPVAERERPHSGHERAPSRQRGHRLGNGAIEAQ